MNFVQFQTREPWRFPRPKWDPFFAALAHIGLKSKKVAQNSVDLRVWGWWLYRFSGTSRSKFRNIAMCVFGLEVPKIGARKYFFCMEKAKIPVFMLKMSWLPATNVKSLGNGLLGGHTWCGKKMRLVQKIGVPLATFGHSSYPTRLFVF